MTTDHSEPLPDAELEAIRADYDGVDEYDTVPRLLAEVDRTRARVEVIDHRLQGICPSCGHQSLTVDERGYLACHWSTCERPDAAALILGDAETDHILYVDDEGFAILHPLHERLDNALLDCDLHTQMDNFAASGRRWPPGRYRVSYDDHIWAFQPIESEGEAGRATT